MKTFQDFLHIMDIKVQMRVSVQLQKGFKRHQTMNKGLI